MDHDSSHPNRAADATAWTIYPPLISDRSPSFLRAQKEASRGVSAEAVVTGALNRLVDAEYEASSFAIRALTMAVHPSQNAELAEEPLKSLADAHRRRGEHLSVLVRALGGSPPDPDETSGELKDEVGPLEDGCSAEACRQHLASMHQALRALYLRVTADTAPWPAAQQVLQELTPPQPLRA